MLRSFASACSCGLVLLVASAASAQVSYPMLMSLKPVAVQVGTTSECEVQSRYTMLGAYQVFISGTGVTAEVVPPEMPKEGTPPLKPGEKPKELLKLKLKFTATADALPGVREFRLATPNGASTLGQLVVVRDPVVVEVADNNTPDKAQAVTLPATLCGAIEKVEDFDYWKFTAEAGQSILFHVRCQRLQDKIHDLQAHADPILYLRDTKGGVLAMADNELFADPFLVHRFEQAGEYILEVRDVRYQGNVYWEYCIEANSRPFVTGSFPKAVAPGVETTLELSGALLPAEPKAVIKLPAETRLGTATGITVVADAASVGSDAGSIRHGGTLIDTAILGSTFVPVTLGDQTSNPLPLYVTNLPLMNEAAGDNNSPMTAATVEVPQVISGRIETEADLDCYSFVAKKGEKFTFEVIARRQMSKLDSFLRILNDKGAALREDDDGRFGRLTHADTWLEGWEAPADGTFTVEIRDVHLRGGPGFEYALQITRTTPYFELEVDTDKTLLTPGLSGAIFVRVVRKHGFTGEVQLHIDGLPPGVTATCGRILAGKSVDGCIVLSAAPDAGQLASDLRIHGTATHPQGEGMPPIELADIAQPYQEYYSPGGGRGHYPVESHVVSIGAPADILAVKLSETDIHLKPGESKKIMVTLERNKDVNQNVTLDMLYKHLDSVYANSLPEGVTIDGNQSQTLLTGNTSEGFITLKADKTAPPCEKQLGVVMANFSLNFVMKSTYSSPPVFVTVEKAE